MAGSKGALGLKRKLGFQTEAGHHGWGGGGGGGGGGFGRPFLRGAEE